MGSGSFLIERSDTDNYKKANPQHCEEHSLRSPVQCTYVSIENLNICERKGVGCPEEKEKPHQKRNDAWRQK